MKSTNLMIVAAVLGATVTVAPAYATEVVFAQIGLTSSATNFRWIANGDSATFYTTSSAGGTAPGAALVTFSLVGSPIPLFTLANFTLSGSTTNQPATNGGINATATQQVSTFDFSINATSDFTYGTVSVNDGDVLLAGSGIQNSFIAGTVTGTTGNFFGSTLGGATISYTSPLLSFADDSNFGFSFTLGSVAPPFGFAQGSTLNSFRSTISGKFQSEPAPTFEVPEPSTWAMMIVGMGLVGYARRRRRVVAAA